MYFEKIEGFFNFDNIYSEAVNVVNFDNALFVEIGTWKGRSAVYMAEQIKQSNKNIKFYTIDLFKYTQDYVNENRLLNDSFYEEVIKNIEPVKQYINLIKSSSDKSFKLFEDNSIDFLFIDGDHNYDGIKKDLELWYPKVKIGGIIGGHDYTEPCGVRQAVDEFFKSKVSIDRTSWIIKK